MAGPDPVAGRDPARIATRAAGEATLIAPLLRAVEALGKSVEDMRHEWALRRNVPLADVAWDDYRLLKVGSGEKKSFNLAKDYSRLAVAAFVAKAGTSAEVRFNHGEPFPVSAGDSFDRARIAEVQVDASGGDTHVVVFLIPAKASSVGAWS